MEAPMREVQRSRYLNQLIRHKHNGLIKIISGIRRCGKSYLLSELFKTHLLACGVLERRIIYLPLDDFINRQYRQPEACYHYVKSRILDNEMHYLLLDEVQMMEGFEDVLNGFLHIKNLDVYVTGSNSKFLSTDIVTEFRGRGDEIRIYPLSFAEYYSVAGEDWADAWKNYCRYGGMPALLMFQTGEDKARYLQNLYKETYLKDMIARNRIQHSNELDELLSVIASSIGGLLNPQKIADTFMSKKIQLSAPTIKQYLNYLQESFLIEKALRYDIKGRKYISTPVKYYFTDIGLRNAKLDFRQQEETHLMENIIFNELNVRGYNTDVGILEILECNERGKRLEKKVEVDFVVNKGDKRCYIQSAYSLPTHEKRQQEERPLLHIRDAFKKIIIVSGSKQPSFDENGVLIMGMKEFLLDENALDV
jgi:predicted AAA+ superfamily ATPase